MIENLVFRRPFCWLEIELKEKKFYPGPGPDPGPLAFRANADMASGV